MCTTNLFESINSVIRKFTRNCKQYPIRDWVLKMNCMAINEAARRWTKPIRNGKETLNYYAIMFEDRLPTRID